VLRRPIEIAIGDCDVPCVDRGKPSQALGALPCPAV